MAANLCKCASVRLSRLCAACVQICANVCKWLPKCASPERPRHQRCAGSRAAMHSLKMHPKESSTHWNALECRDTEKRKSKFSTETAPCSITTKNHGLAKSSKIRCSLELSFQDHWWQHLQCFLGGRLPAHQWHCSAWLTPPSYSWMQQEEQELIGCEHLPSSQLLQPLLGSNRVEHTYIWAQCFGFQHHPWVG